MAATNRSKAPKKHLGARQPFNTRTYPKTIWASEESSAICDLIDAAQTSFGMGTKLQAPMVRRLGNDPAP